MTRRRALAWGAVAATSWIALAAISARLSPLARRPLLGGRVTGVDFRWVDAPAALVPTDVLPIGAEFDPGVRGGASEADVVLTHDNQGPPGEPGAMVTDVRAGTRRLAVTPA